MKLSEAILKGMERFSEQAIGNYQTSKNAACALGCAGWVVCPEDPALGWSRRFVEWNRAYDHFQRYYGCDIPDANDGGLLRAEIVGMLQHIGH